MKAKVLLSGNNDYHIVYPDGSINYNASINHLYEFFLKFTEASLLNGSSDAFFDKSEGTDISEFSIPGCHTVAYVNDYDDLVINNPSPLSYLLSNKENILIPNFVTLKEYASTHHKAVTTIRQYCQDKKIVCIKKGHDWLIDPSCPLPPDRRKKENK